MRFANRAFLLRIFEPHPRAFIKKSYADNFKFGRIGSWTH